VTDNREVDVVELLKAYKHTEVVTLFVELFSIRRERYRDKLESSEQEQVRGRSKECKELLQLFS